MLTITISNTYLLRWSIKGYPDYAITTCKKVVHKKKAKLVKQVLNNGTLGYKLNGKFLSLKEINKLCEIIKVSSCPF
jgi:hypothetical protein